MGLVQVDPSVSPRVLEGAMMFELRRCQRFFADVKIHDLSQVCYGSPFNDRGVAQTVPKDITYAAVII